METSEVVCILKNASLYEKRLKREKELEEEKSLCVVLIHCKVVVYLYISVVVVNARVKKDFLLPNSNKGMYMKSYILYFEVTLYSASLVPIKV